MDPQVITVTQFMNIINETLGFAYPSVVVEGEVSSFKINQGKFAFFDLKDENNVISCFMMARQLKLPIEDGMKIRVTGAPKVTKFSKFSLTVRDIQLAGEGELRRAMALLKSKLEGEGLFDPARKRTLPKYPHRIGLITSGTSAAYSDFIKIINARWSGLQILLADVSVQGASAPDQIVGAIEHFNHLNPPVDVVVLIRGGGSLEDLMAFSTEPVARAVAASRTPIMTGVGHEIDTSLADYASDLRAATPTDAARLVVPDRSEIASRIGHLQHRVDTHLSRSITLKRSLLDQSVSRLEAYLRHPRERVTAHEAILWRSLERLSSRHRQAASQLSAQEHRLTALERVVIPARRNELAALERVLHSFDPTAVLKRGYSITRAGNKLVRSPADAPSGASLVIQLGSGTIDAKVERS